LEFQILDDCQLHKTVNLPQESGGMPLQDPLKIGYLWQSETADMTQLSASVLHIKAVIRGLEQRGHRVRMVSIPDRQHQWTDDLAQWTPICSQRPGAMQLVESGLRNIQSRLRLPYFNFFDSYHFSSAAMTALADCDVLYERYWLLNYGGLLTARRLGIPLVLEVNGDLIEEYDQLNIELSKAQWAAIHFINRRLFQGASHVVTVSEHLRRRTIERWGVDPARVTTVTNGAHVEEFVHLTDSQDVRKRYHLGSAPVIMFVGNFKPWHGLELLIEGFQRVALTNSTAKLVLVGDGSLRSEIEENVKALGLETRVIFTGKVPHDEVAGLLGIAQIAVMTHPPSQAAMSGTPMKLLEYMAAGKAIIAPCLPNIESILSQHRTGYLVPPGDAEALACAILELLCDERMRVKIGNAAQQRALNSHSWGRVAADLESIMYQVQNGQSV
jgi:glycosyltransferase involved in cell wall biosynthesis